MLLVTGYNVIVKHWKSIYIDMFLAHEEAAFFCAVIGIGQCLFHPRVIVSVWGCNIFYSFRTPPTFEASPIYEPSPGLPSPPCLFFLPSLVPLHPTILLHPLQPSPLPPFPLTLLLLHLFPISIAAFVCVGSMCIDILFPIVRVLFFVLDTLRVFFNYNSFSYPINH